MIVQCIVRYDFVYSKLVVSLMGKNIFLPHTLLYNANSVIVYSITLFGLRILYIAYTVSLLLRLVDHFLLLFTP